ncbi:response regulator [Paenibacillus eucommiae]|uniref:Two-component system chemotaxis response regulator CheY n=1 Tax=Paenibacillus eucommiae TaxID=1355755 RepID=A0ABS4J845_9BACL|nr:response regulator [Paenibacillus eucommiae]MBP1996021.1 two-component system chemotaxis response regulator CheY [Paenibacillus eucommiae]
MSGIKVLVVDDTAFMRMLMRAILEELGHQVVGEARNGIEAISMYQRIRPELVTMDITMPELDGISAVKKIKSIDPSAKIIMCSAMGQREMVLEAVRSGASDFVVKPVHRDRLIEAIQRVFVDHFKNETEKNIHVTEGV